MGFCTRGEGKGAVGINDDSYFWKRERAIEKTTTIVVHGGIYIYFVVDVHKVRCILGDVSPTAFAIPNGLQLREVNILPIYVAKHCADILSRNLLPTFTSWVGTGGFTTLVGLYVDFKK